MRQKELLKIIEEAARDGRTELDLSNKGIKSLPAEIGRLTNLTKLNLESNELKSIPKEIGQLTNLRELYLHENKLTSIPKELGQLTNLTELGLGGNQLTSVPKELGRSTNLTKLVLGGNKLKSVPKVLGQLTNLKTLYLDANQLTSVPKELCQLTNLQTLILFTNQLTSVPKELGQLTNLQTLILFTNQLTNIPNELGQLRNLKELWLNGNQLTSIPKELGGLTNLTWLRLSGNQLTSVPKELGQLTNLKDLRLNENQLTSVPKELGRLENLTILDLKGNPLESPPPEVVKQGTKAILAYLRELQIGEGLKWEAKLLIVGEAGVGKTELVKALHDEKFGGESATEGILIRPLNIRRPKQPRVEMKLNLWDFGGQEIQHATHQFFYSERALFLLAWNARENYEQAKFNDWLELIQARVSVKGDKKDEKKEWRVPVLMVATHCDLWRPDIPYEELKRQFPGIRFLGLIKVSNKPPRNGIENLRKALAEAASNLPLMGMRWPNDWQEVENKLSEKVENKESRMELGELGNLMDEAKVSEGSREIFIRVLDGMGKIRVFLDDEKLRDTVVLNPQWLTNRIARVLKNQDKEEKPICKHAILQRNQWPIFWPDESEETHRKFVRMMRNFDLVYELEDSPEEGWLVVL